MRTASASQERAGPPANIHAGEASSGDIHFLYGMGVALQRSQSMASVHAGSTGDAAVTALAGQIAQSHSAQLASVNQLRSRLGSGAAGGTTAATTSGHGQGGGQSKSEVDPTGEYYRRFVLVGVEQERAASAPYGNVAYADPGYQPDKKKRYPIDTHDHVQAALSYLSKAKNAARYTASQLSAMWGRIRAAAKKFGIKVSADTGKSGDDVPGELVRSGAREGEFFRSVPFELAVGGDGWTLEGYAAVFNERAHVRDELGEYDEVIMPGAFRDQIAVRDQWPVLMFEHGKHPLIGSMPLGELRHLEEDSKGLGVHGRLSDNWLIEPVRDAIRDGGVKGMSFRLIVPNPERDEKWTPRYPRHGEVQLREVSRIRTRELGPVVFPVYRPTTAQIRSLIECIDCGSDAGSAGGSELSRAAPGNGNALAQADAETVDRYLRYSRLSPLAIKLGK